MLNVKQYFTSQYLFEIDRVTLHRSDKAFVLAGIIAVVLAVAFRILAIFAHNPVVKRLILRLFNLVLFVGLAEVVWFGARYQNIRFFGSHFVAMLILLIGLVWFGFIAKYFFGKYKAELESWQKQQIKLKYLQK